MSRLNPRLAKIHRNYTVEEVAALCNVHKNTVRQWIKNDLRTIDDKRPTLILGRHLRHFLEERRTKNKVKCQPGEFYCLKCRKPRLPADMKAECERTTNTLGNLIGICNNCGTIMYRRVNLTKLAAVSGNLMITIPEDLKHIVRRDKPSLNSVFKE